MQCEMLSEFPHLVLPLPCNVYNTFRVCDVIVTWSTCYWYGSQAVAHLCACVCESERWTFIQ